MHARLGLTLVHVPAQPEHFLLDELGGASTDKNLSSTFQLHLQDFSRDEVGGVGGVSSDKTPQNPSTHQNGYLRLRCKVEACCEALARGAHRPREVCGVRGVSPDARALGGMLQLAPGLQALGFSA